VSKGIENRMTIEDQFEQWRIFFREKWAKPINKYDEADFDEDFDTLLRFSVKKFHKLLNDMHVKYPITVNQTIVDIIEDEISRQFDWLEK